MTDKAYAVPLHEQLASVPRDARLVIDDADGTGTRFIPVGRMCHEAAEALRARLAQPEQQRCKHGVWAADHCYQCEAQPEPEPVAWRCNYCRDTGFGIWGDVCQRKENHTTPPQREWQGLTDEEIEDEYFDNWSMSQMCDFARAIEAKLKERNS